MIVSSEINCGSLVVTTKHCEGRDDEDCEGNAELHLVSKPRVDRLVLDVGKGPTGGEEDKGER